MKYCKCSDAVVYSDDAIKWAEEALREKPGVVVDRVMNAEPFALGMVVHTAQHIVDKLTKAGVQEALANTVFDNIVSSSAIMLEMMQKGYRQLWDDLIEPDDDGPAATKGEAHV